jgi:hypothetical protein
MISAAAYVLKVKRTFAQGIVTGRPRPGWADEGDRSGLGAKPRARSGVSRMRRPSAHEDFVLILYRDPGWRLVYEAWHWTVCGPRASGQ